MWKKPSIEKPDFKKANLETMVSFAEITEKESLETNGGSSIGTIEIINIGILKPIKITRTPGIVASPFNFKL
ncbi:MAG TPA: hypothetical protein VF941_09775 [Clostridia bacterium]